MGVYRAAIVTENGQNLIAQALANEKPLIFTSAKTPSYSYPVGTDVPALTGLQDVVQSVLPFDSKVLGGNVAQVSVRFDNDGVDQTYRIETIGLYAKIEGGAETLFSVTQATTPDEMPVQSDISPSAYIYNIQHTVQNASQITLTVNPAGTATVQDIMDIESPEFDDSGTVEGISSFPSFLEAMKSKMNFFQFFRNLKAGLQFVLHTGQIVNNCVTDNSSLPLSAAQGKALMDKYTQLYSDMQAKNSPYGNILAPGDASGLNVNGYLMSRFGLNGVPTSKKDDKYYIAVDANNKLRSGIQVNGADKITWKEVATKDDLALVSLLLSGTSEVSSSNLYATMKGKREIQVSGWFRTSSTKPTGAKIFSIPSGYTIGINTTLLAMESVSGAIISLWCDQRGTTFTTQREIPAGQYYVIPIPIQLQSA
ncbi:hypothetical protein WMO21_11745 [Lachnospiraceae bacterium CLA-AA-H58]|uniref:hypothetical protein n=1 Tax=Pilosibacter fragilis TaxID=3078042 RepID=UPI0032D43C4C